jgi:excinuclease ABC subunit C
MSRTSLPENVAEKLKVLPAQPGCYIYKDDAGDVLYVGKALVLKNRVRSYFQASTRHGARIERMVRKVRDIEWFVVESEVEALVLECNLIKRYRPPFNVRLRDDKSYPYVVITNEKFPRILFTRKVRKDGSKYFGPYTSAGSVRDTLQLLHKIFPLIPCGKSWSGRDEQRPCLYYHLGQCLGPCAGLADQAEYKTIVKRVEAFLAGKAETVVDGIKAEMKEASESLDFEQAAKLRNQLQAIENLQQRQKVLSHDSTDQDVIAVVKDERGASIQMLYVRNGKLIGQRHFVLDGSSDAAPSEAVGEFVKQYYSDSPDVPREVLLPVEIEEREVVQQWLRSKKGAAVTVGVPQGGEKLRLVEMAAANAEQAMSTFSEEIQQKEAFAERAMTELQDGIGLAVPPIRIEGYDISNIQGTSPVGSMVVVESGEAAKAEYRRFKIRYHPESPNDFAMMHEVITRRLRNYIEGDEKFQKIPDLIMIDGGRGQLSAALKARDEQGLAIPMVGLAKKMELIFVPREISGLTPEEAEALPKLEPGIAPVTDANYTFDRRALKEYAYEAVELPLNSPGLMLLRKLRDEAHRFAITFHRKLRDKRFSGSVLEEIPGVGPRRRRLLLRTFGSLEGIRRASVEELASVPTMTKTLAGQVRDYLRDE